MKPSWMTTPARKWPTVPAAEPAAETPSPDRQGRLLALVQVATGKMLALRKQVDQLAAAKDALTIQLAASRGAAALQLAELLKTRHQLDWHERQRAVDAATGQINPDTHARADLARALQTLHLMENRLAVYEKRPSPIDCPRACCNPLPATPADATAARNG